jgi:predicted ATPase
LFVEELTKMVLESGLLRDDGQQYALAGALQPFAIPTTVQDSLTARLDRLSSAKPVAQLGAALGREFRYEVLLAVSSLDDTSLQRELVRLMDAELLYEGKPPPDATYLFKHVLVQDAAYQSLLRSTRQQYHQQIAQVLADQFPESAETEPEVLAHHLTLAGLVEEAVTYWLRAGRRAVDGSAYVEAIRHLRRGLELLRGLPDTLERAQQELPLQATLGLPLLMTRGYAADEVEQAFARARALCDQIGETPQMYPVLWGLWAFYVVRTNFQASTDVGDQLLFLGTRQADAGLLLEAHAAHGLNYFWQGDLATARDHFERAIGYYDPVEHRSHAELYGQDAAVISYSHLSLLLWIQGYPDQALARHRQALELAKARAHAFSLGLALAFAAICHQLRRDPPVARTFADQCIAITSEHGFALWLADGEIIRGWALAHLGDGVAGLAQLRHGVAGFAAIGALLWVTHQLGLVAEVCGLLGQVDDALAEVEQGLAIADRSGERYFEAELYRLKGELLLQRTVPTEAEAEAAFLRALEIARRQGAKSFELRAALSLCRLRRRRGGDEGALALLRNVYAWFTEGFDTADHREAEAMLAASEPAIRLAKDHLGEAADAL